MHDFKIRLHQLVSLCLRRCKLEHVQYFRIPLMHRDFGSAFFHVIKIAAMIVRKLAHFFKSWEADGLSIEILNDNDDTQHGTFLCSGNERLQIAIQEKVEEHDPSPTDEEKLHPKWEWKKRTAFSATSELTLFLDGKHITSYIRFYRRYKDCAGSNTCNDTTITFSMRLSNSFRNSGNWNDIRSGL